jgi:hypothetical protein
MDPSFTFLHRLLMAFLQRLRYCDNMLTFVMLEQLQGRASKAHVSTSDNTHTDKETCVFMTSACVMEVFCAISSMLMSSVVLSKRSMMVSAQ